MKIAPYYQSLLEENIQAVKSMEPITFCGMYDSGIDYVFSLLLPLLQAECGDTHHLLSLDLSGLDTPEAIETEISYLLSEFESSVSDNLGYFGITSKIKQLAKNKPVHLSIYGGQEETIDKSLLLLLNRLRNLLGWNFSYTLFINAKNILSHNYSLLSKKVMFRNLIWVLPLDNENTRVVIKNYEERYQFKLSSAQLNMVQQLSGGNPGLVKSLYLLAKKDELDNKVNIHDSGLALRLQGIISDLGSDRPSLQPFNPLLVNLGYLKQVSQQAVWFTELMDQFLSNIPTQQDFINGRSVDEKLLSLTYSQRKLLDYLENNQSKIIKREEIARVIWGEQWDTKYSDWAIDQMISTLRKKMKTIKYNGKLVTKRGEGITFIAGA